MYILHHVQSVGDYKQIQPSAQVKRKTVLATRVNSRAKAHSLKYGLFNFCHKSPPPFGNPNLYLVNRVKKVSQHEMAQGAQSRMERKLWWDVSLLWGTLQKSGNPKIQTFSSAPRHDCQQLETGYLKQPGSFCLLFLFQFLLTWCV